MKNIKPILVAEISANHNGDFNLAKKLMTKKSLVNLKAGEHLTRKAFK